jgi:NADPH-dependent ferric siderophore reductase
VNDINTLNKPDLTITRVRHPLKMRLLQVKRVHAVTPHMVRITLSGDDLEGFESSSFDDHVKVFFPHPGQDMPTIPQLSPDGPIRSESGLKPIARDFTPRRHDAAAGELDIEFALHEGGPATTWAAQAKVGQTLGIGGPKGSMLIPTGFDWHLLIGDDTALPAIARRIEEMPANARVAAVIEVQDPSAKIEFSTQAHLHVEWRYRSESDYRGAGLLLALRETYLPDGEGFVWAACESTVVRAVRQHLVEERGISKDRIRASSYWKRGADATHETLND